MRKIAVFLLLIAFVPAIVQGFSFEPLSQDFTPTQSGRIRTFRVSNNQNEQIAVRLKMTTRALSPSGEELREDASADFLVFPSRVTLAPGTSQAVRVQWLGAETIESELSYRIFAEQVPVSFEDEAAAGVNINILFRYIGSVYVVPPGARADVAITEAVREYQDAELTGLRLRLENRGTAHGIVQNPVVHLVYAEEQSGLTEELEISGDQIALFSGVNLLAGSSLTEVVEIPAHWKLGTVDATINYHLLQ